MEFIKCSLLKSFTCFFLFQITLVSCDSQLEEVTVGRVFTSAEVKELLITRKKNDGKSGASGLFTETKVIFKVSEVNDVLKGDWVYGETVLVGAEANMIGTEEQEIINIYEGLSFNLEVKQGKVSLLNYEVIRKDLEELFLKVYKIDKSSDESGMYQRVSNMFQTKASSPASLLNTFFPEIPLLFSTINTTYVNNDVMVLDSIQSPYRKSFIDIVSVITVDKIDDEVQILRSDSISQNVLDEQLKMYMEDMFGEQAQTIPFSQMPRFNYKAYYSIWLNEDKQLTEIEKSMFLSNGGNDMSNSLMITVVN